MKRFRELRFNTRDELLEANGSFSGVDIVAFTVPAFIRFLEYAREDAKADIDLHKVVEEILKFQSNTGKAIDSIAYETIMKKAGIKG